MRTTGTLRVEDRYESFQGTGVLTGIRQYFVRLAGCRVPCPLRANCDQPQSLDHKVGKDVEIDTLIKAALDTGWMHITGGEPVEQSLFCTLAKAGIAAGLRVQVQTSGTLWIDPEIGIFVSVSPKTRDIYVSPSEMILIATKWMTHEFALAVSESVTCPIYVVPEATDGQFNVRRMFKLLKLLEKSGKDVRAGLQAHLIWDKK